jgi:hypothetical protein
MIVTGNKILALLFFEGIGQSLVILPIEFST